MTSRPHDRSLHLGRRRLMGGVLVAGALSLSACDDVLAEPAGEAASGRGVGDPDEALLDEAVLAEGQVAAGISDLLRSAPRRRRADLQRTLEVHQTHLRLLAPDQGAPRELRARLRQEQLVRAEEALARLHTDLAVRAVSGQLARVLAGMAAASAQQADLWRGRA